MSLSLSILENELIGCVSYLNNLSIHINRELTPNKMWLTLRNGKEYFILITYDFSKHTVRYMLSHFKL